MHKDGKKRMKPINNELSNINRRATKIMNDQHNEILLNKSGLYRKI